MSGLTKKDDQARFSIELGANKRSSILRSFSVSVMRSQSPSEVDVPKIPFLLCIVEGSGVSDQFGHCTISMLIFSNPHPKKPIDTSLDLL